MPCVTPGSIHLFEDSSQVLLTSFTNEELFDLMTQAANDLIATHGDVFDFVGFWIDFTADHEVGAAFYLPIFNDVMGIGDPSTEGTPIFDFRSDLGLASTKVDGYVMMWDVNHFYWAPGDGPAAGFTRLVLGQEFEHRWALFLPDLLDGRQLQGDNSSCGRAFHWNFRVDGQGSGMEIGEWVGASPATLLSTSAISFNTDIPGGVFSYTDLYLMGYVSPAEMDAGNSELRYMDTSGCSSTYNGSISNFTSADVVATAGARVPDSGSAQRDHRTGWVMIHLPGQRPTYGELGKAAGILQQHQIDFRYSTLGRGTMNNVIASPANGRFYFDCPRVLALGSAANPEGSLTVLDGRAGLGASLVLGVDNPLGTQAPGARTYVLVSSAPPLEPGVLVEGFGMRGPGEAGELLLRADGVRGFVGPPWPGPGRPAAVEVRVPADPSLLGTTLWAQGAIVDPGAPGGARVGLTNALALPIGP